MQANKDLTSGERLSDFAEGSDVPLLSLNLPTDRVRSPGQNESLAAVPLELDEKTLAAFSAKMGGTSAGLGNALLACSMILIRRLTAEQDIAIDILQAERKRLVVSLHGLDRFASSPPVFALAGSTTAVMELLRGLEKVVEGSIPVPPVTHAKSGAQVLFVWQHEVLAASDTGIDVNMLGQVDACELILSFRSLAGKVSGRLFYSERLFDEDTAARFAENFRVISGAVATAETAQVGDLPLLGAAERSRILDEWSGHDVAFPADKCVHQLFEEQVSRSPSGTALVQGEAKLSYDELNRQANRLAHHLLQLGLRPDARVAVCLPRSFEVMVAQLAIMKAGGAYVPLDPRHPESRLKAMIADCEPVAIVTRADLAGLLSSEDGKGPRLLDFQAPSWLDEPDVDPAPARCGPNNLAYVIYTSGSTGRPKGVLIEHRGLTNLIVSQIKDFQVDSGSRVLQYASFSFDASVSEIYSTLCAGATLVLPLSGEIVAGEVLAKVLLDHQISHVTLPPPVLATLSTMTQFSALRVLIVAGDALPKSLVAHWSKGRHFINAYGPTETTVMATVNPGINDHTPNPSIGRPMDNARLYILDRNLQPAPIGVPGEIYIGGVGVARGYLNRPDLTAERFVQDPFTRHAGGRMYKSGDLGRWWPDGSIEYLGRNDFQLKIRGMRVEPGEIEAALRVVHPGTKECAVLAREIGGQKHLVAYYVQVREAQPMAREKVREMLANHLPAHMVPSLFVAVDKMPLTSNGKLDREALPAAVLRGESEREPPVGAAESAISKAFSKYTGALRVGRNDDFFSLGGSSLSAVLCVDRLNREFARPITLREFVESPTPRSLALKASARNDSQPARERSITPSGPTICLLPGVGGDEPRLAQFRIRSETFSRVVPIEYPDWSSLVGNKNGLDFLMDYFVRQIDAHCGAQPVYLIGYSFGGLCAHAVALRLSELGRRVVFVAFLDTDARLVPTTVQAAQTQFAGRWHYLMETFLDVGRTLGAIPRKEFTAVFSLSLVRFLTSPVGRWMLPLLVRHRHRRLPIRFGYFLHRYLNEALQVWTLESWRRAIVKRPKPLAVPAYLFRSEEHAPADPADLGWRSHFPGLKVIPAKGAHNTMLDPPNLDKLCDEVELAVGGSAKAAEKLAIHIV